MVYSPPPYNQFITKFFASGILHFIKQVFKLGSMLQPEKLPQPDKNDSHSTISNQNGSTHKAPTKNKPIRKLNRKQRKSSIEEATRSEPNKEICTSWADNSPEENYEILFEYFSHQITQFYRNDVPLDQLQSLEALVKLNLLDMKSIFSQNLSEIWGEDSATDQELLSYFQLIKAVTQANNKFNIIYDEVTGDHYCILANRDNSLAMKISDRETTFLKIRQDFLRTFEISQRKFFEEAQGKSSPMSEISRQIAFLYYALYHSTKNFREQIIRIKTSLNELKESQNEGEDALEESDLIQNQYFCFKIKKLLQDSLKDCPIDYLNYFKDREIAEHGLTSAKGSIKDVKQFQQFLKKRKPSKLYKTCRSILHTACEGCMSASFENQNPFIYCQECGIRFHQSCFDGVYLTQKTVLCTSCSIKLASPDKKKRVKKRQCNFCGAKGLLFTRIPENKQIHTYCMLMNGLWRMKNKKATYSAQHWSMEPEKNKCICCQQSNIYTKKCISCDNHAHPSCAYLNGWEMQAKFEQGSFSPTLMVKCCGENNQQRQSRRKFVIYYRKESLKRVL